MFEGMGLGAQSLPSVLCPKAAPPHVPTRPGSCAGVGAAALFSSSQDLPDDVLLFIKAHPLLDPAVPPATHQPLLTLTSRYSLPPALGHSLLSLCGPRGESHWGRGPVKQ